MTWLLTTLAALAAAFYIAAPFYREASLRSPAGAPLRARQRELEGRREGLLRELKELELDRRMGKVDAEQYAQSRARATQEASQVLRQIEALRSPEVPRAPRPKAPVAPAPPLSASLSAPLSQASLDLEIELEVAVARARRQKKQALWTCDCGRVMQQSDLFCGSCGRAKSAEPAGARSQTQTEAAAL